MKKVFSIIVVLVIAVCFSSCKKGEISSQQETTINPITYKSFQEQKVYIAKHIKIVTTEFAKAMKDIKVRKLVDAKALEQVGGDYSVLISELMKYPEFVTRIDIKKMQDGIDAFKGIEGEDMKLQVYVPRFAKQKDVQLDDIDPSADEVEYVIPNGDETEVDLPGWELDDNDDLVLSGRMIGETYADTHAIYLIAFQETEEGPSGGSGSGSGFTPSLTNDDIMTYDPPPLPANPFSLNVQIEKMGVKELKEPWWKGKADVAIRAFRLTWNGKVDGHTNGADVDYGSNQTTTSFRGNEIFQFARQTVHNVPIDAMHLKFNLQSNWDVSNYSMYPVIYAYTIFETDNWPTGKKTEAIYPFFADFPSQYRSITFRSGDASYYTGSFYGTNDGWQSGFTPTQNVTYYNNSTFKQFKEDNSSIKYNIIRY